jgi:branched-chain amino acid transport system permease protein
MLAQQIANAVLLGSVYALFALGFTLVFGVLRLINLLYGFYFTCGAYLALFAVTAAGMPIWLAGLAGAAGAGLVGVALDTALLSRLRKMNAPELSALVVTLGAALMLDNLMTIFMGAGVRRFPASAVNDKTFSLGPIEMGATQIAILAAALIAMAALFVLVERSRLGAAIRAVSENPSMAALMGVNVGLTVSFVSFISAAMAGGAGMLVGLNFDSIAPYMGEAMMLRAFAVIIVGGLGDIRGAVLAGFALGFVEVMTVAYVSSSLREAVGFIALVLVLWYRPSGLFSRAIAKRA